MRQRPRGKAPSGWSAEDLGPVEGEGEARPEPPAGGVWLIDDLVEPARSAAAAASLARLEGDRPDLWRFEPAAPPDLDPNLFKPLSERLESRPAEPKLPRRQSASAVRKPFEPVEPAKPVEPAEPATLEPVEPAAPRRSDLNRPGGAQEPETSAKAVAESPDFAPVAFPFRAAEPEAAAAASGASAAPLARSTKSAAHRKAEPKADDTPSSPASASASVFDEPASPSTLESDVYDLVAESFGRPQSRTARRAKPVPEPVAAENPSPEPAAPEPAPAKPEPALWRADSSAADPAPIPVAARVAKPSSQPTTARRTYARLPEPEPDPTPAPAPIEPLPIDERSAFEPRVIQPPVADWPGFDRAPVDRAPVDRAAVDRTSAARAPIEPVTPDLPPVVQRPVSTRPAVERPDLAWPEFSWPEAPGSRGPFEPKLSRDRSPKPVFDAEQFADAGHEEPPAPQQVPLPDSMSDPGWLDTVHWHDASETDEDANGQHGRRPGAFRRRKGNSA